MERQDEVFEAIEELAWEAAASAIYLKQKADPKALEERLRLQVTDDAWKAYAAIDEFRHDQPTEVNDYLIRIVFSIATSIEPKSLLACDGFGEGQ